MSAETVSIENIPTGVFVSEPVQLFASMVRAELVHALREIKQAHASMSDKNINLMQIADACLLPYRQLSIQLEQRETSEIVTRHYHFTSFQNLFLLEYNRQLKEDAIGHHIETDYSPVSPGKFMAFVYTSMYEHGQHVNLLQTMTETELSMVVYSAMRRAASQVVRILYIAEQAAQPESQPEKEINLSPTPKQECNPPVEIRVEPSDSISNVEVGGTTSIEQQLRPFFRNEITQNVELSTEMK